MPGCKAYASIYASIRLASTPRGLMRLYASMTGYFQLGFNSFEGPIVNNLIYVVILCTMH